MPLRNRVVEITDSENPFTRYELTRFGVVPNLRLIWPLKSSARKWPEFMYAGPEHRIRDGFPDHMSGAAMSILRIASNSHLKKYRHLTPVRHSLYQSGIIFAFCLHTVKVSCLFLTISRCLYGDIRLRSRAGHEADQPILNSWYTRPANLLIQNHSRCPSIDS
jgi:hypothetical protein